MKTLRFTRIVTAFITDERKILLLKRSDKVKTMKSLWAGVSGIIENNETPLSRAITEIHEEIGLEEDQFKLLKEAKQMKIISPQYKNHSWSVFPFLFEAKNPKIKLNWENSEYKWISAEEITNYKTVPELEKVLFNLL